MQGQLRSRAARENRPFRCCLCFKKRPLQNVDFFQTGILIGWGLGLLEEIRQAFIFRSIIRGSIAFTNKLARMAWAMMAMAKAIRYRLKICVA